MRLVLLTTLLLLTACSDTRADIAGAEVASEPGAEALAEARAFSATQPYYLQAADSGGVPAGLPDLRASTCGECHRDIYAEWQISTHARAYLDDPQFQAELHKSRLGDNDVGWM